MKKIITLLFLTLFSKAIFAQIAVDPSQNKNAAQSMLSGNFSKGVTIGGYAQIDYNQPLYDNVSGTLDVHRLVLLFGYKFSEEAHFITEIEYEHVSEVYIEQAFLNYKISDEFNLRGGLMLIPMGFINEYHEPTQYNGVERPNLDSYIIPSTWREIGFGATGSFNDIGLSYQAYVFGGFKSFDNGAVLRGSDALRKGRQKGANAIFQNANLSAKVNYYGINGLKFGLAAYSGKTSSSLINGVDTQDANLVAQADSSVINVNMFGLDGQYNYRAFEAKMQVVLAKLGNTDQYNQMNSSDLGSELFGYYFELGYDVLTLFKEEAEQRMVVFARYENYDTHHKVEGNTAKKEAFDRKDLTFGLSYHLANGAVVKADYQLRNNKLNSDYKPTLNFGIGIWF